MKLGLPVTWDNPDIAVLLGGVEQNTFDLRVDTEYEIRTTGWSAESGRLVPELREVIHGAYRVIYRIESGRVSVLTVRYGRRLLDPSGVVEGE